MAISLVAGIAAAMIANPRPASTPLEPPEAAASRALTISIEDLLRAAQIVEELGTDDAWAAARLEDAWRALGLVYQHEQAQLDVAAGRRLPLMSAPPLAPGRPGHEAAFNRAAVTYLSAALPERDLEGVRRALDLIELGRR
ncbi:MAG TPA: hypothetical protein VFX49_16765 [Chloroflexota bacterium]|nr:hypothetical protein [Chloroflexota bacterium]